jgi:hypothetical protein
MNAPVIEPPPYRDLVVPELRPFFDRMVEMVVAGGADTDHPLALQPAAWAALTTALVQSIQAHRLLAKAGSKGAAARLPLLEALLIQMTNAESIDEVMPDPEAIGVRH